jgi:hypothetical protein
VLSMLPRVGRRSGGAPMATRRERVVAADDGTVVEHRRFGRDRVVQREPVGTSANGTLDDRA